MPINVKRSNNYSNQKLKIKNPSGFGRFITKLPPGVTLPVIACLPSGGTLGNFSPKRLVYSSYAVMSSSLSADPFVYGGFVAPPSGTGLEAIENFGYLWNSGSKSWDFRVGVDPNSSYTQLGGEAASAGQGKVITVGGFKFDISIPAISYHSCSIYNKTGDCWTYAGNIPGFSKTRLHPGGGNLVATNYATGEVFVFGGADSSNLNGSGATWVNQMLVWSNDQFTNVGTFPFLTSILTNPANLVSLGGAAGLGVRDTPAAPNGRNKVMLFSGYYGNDLGGAIYLWTQNQLSPVSGTWSFKCGMNETPGPWNINIPDPYSSIMWDQVNNRWIAISRWPHSDPNIWESTDDGATWSNGWFNSHGYRFSGTSGAAVSGDTATITHDPGRSRAYYHLYRRKDDSGVLNGGELWELNIPANINDASFVQVSGSAVANQFDIQRLRRLTQFGVTDDSPPKIFVYGGVSGSGGGYGESSNKHVKGFLYNQGTSTWAEIINDNNYPSSDVKKGRFFGDVATLAGGNLLMIGGRTGTFLGGDFFRPYTNHNNSRKYTVSTNTWDSPVSLSGYNSYLEFRGIDKDGSPATTNLVTTDLTSGNVFLFGGVDGSALGGSWVDKLSVYDGATWSSLGSTNPPVIQLTDPGPTGGIPIGGDATPSQQYYSLGARNVSGNTRLLLYQGQRINISGVVSRSQNVYKWDQTSSSPIAGTWSVVSGSTGLSESNKMPVDSATLMWEDSQSRWVAISNNPRTSPNIWSSTDDGLTWTAATYTVSSLAWEATRVADQIKPSPASSQFYIQSTYGIGKWGIWSVNVAASIGSSTLNLIYTN